MNKTFLYLSVSFLGLAPFSSKANDLGYSSPNISPNPQKYETPDPLGTTHFSDLPAEVKGNISQNLTDKEIGSASQTSKENYQQFNNDGFYEGFGQSKEQRFSQVKEFIVDTAQGIGQLTSYLINAQKQQFFISIRILFNRFENYYFEEFLQFLSLCTPVSLLDLSDSKIDDEGVINIITAITNPEMLPNLNKLILRSNPLGDKGEKALDALKTKRPKLLLDHKVNQILEPPPFDITHLQNMGFNLNRLNHPRNPQHPSTVTGTQPESGKLNSKNDGTSGSETKNKPFEDDDDFYS